MNDPHDDKLLKLYQQSRQEQPSTQMDNKIRKAAKAAHYRKHKRWLWGLSTAAVIVISFNVVFELVFMEETGSQLEMIPPLIQTQEAPSVIRQQKMIGPDTMESEVDELIDEMDSADDKEFARLQEIHSGGRLKESRQALMPKKSLNALERPPAVKYRSQAKALDLGAIAPSSAMHPAVYIPDLPANLEQLLAIDPDIKGQQSTRGLITLTVQNKVILVVNPEGRTIQFKAWPGSERLGIKLDWNLIPTGMRNCEFGPVYTRCDISDDVRGYFEGNRLDHISWQRVDE